MDENTYLPLLALCLIFRLFTYTGHLVANLSVRLICVDIPCHQLGDKFVFEHSDIFLLFKQITSTFQNP